jgi:hypothetical protein
MCRSSTYASIGFLSCKHFRKDRDKHETKAID